MIESFWEKKIARRDFFKASAGAAAALAVSTVIPAYAGAEKKTVLPKTKISWADCQKMSPVTMAEQSAMVKNGYKYLLSEADKLLDSKVKDIVFEGLKKPHPKLMERFVDKESKQLLKQRLLSAGYIKADNTLDQILPPCKGADTCVQRFDVSPGSGWQSHHAYPGGLVTHVATDLQIALHIYDCYENMYGYSMQKDLLRSAILLHDNQKPWVLQWREDDSCLPEVNIAGTGVHHILEIADAIYRELDPNLVVAIACSHDHPGFAADEAQVIGWIKAAAVIADKDPVKYGLLASDEQTLPLPRRAEGFLVHLGDHDFVLTAPVSKWLSQELKQIARKLYSLSDEDLQGKPFNTFRNYVFSQQSDMQLYQLWTDKGEDALMAEIEGMVVPQ